MGERVPEGWVAKKLKDVSVLTKGLTYASSDYSDEQNGLPFLTLKSISKDGGYSPVGLKFYKGEYREHHALNIGDILFANTDLTRNGDVVGSPLFFDGFGFDGTTLYSMDLSKLKVDLERTHSKFLYYLLMTHRVKRYMVNSSAGSTVLHLDTNRVKELKLNLPPLPEQKKIASILTSVDEVIATTQKQIDKLQDLKKATMNELLTEGIGHTEFKDSELGRIPKSWELVKLGDTGKWKGGGTPSKSNSEFWEGSIPWVSPKDMKYEYISKTEDYVSDYAVVNSSTSLIEAGAILIVVRSGILKHTLPVAISKCNLTINQDMKALSVSNNFSNLFIYHYLVARNHLVLRSTLKAGNTVESIDTQVFSKYLIPSPPLQEQIEIANAIESIASQIRKKKRKLTQTQYLKKSLMQDLLTGKVRVQVN